MEEMYEMREMNGTQEENKNVNRIGVLFLLIFMLILSRKAFSASDQPFEIPDQNYKILSYQERNVNERAYDQHPRCEVDLP